MRALVVDDSRAMRSLLRRFLVEAGFDVFEAEHGLDALTKLRASALPDVTLVDWNMPEMDGLAFIESIRADPALRSLRVLMVTTENEPMQIVRALDSGADEYMMKPFTKEILMDKLRMLGLHA